MAYHVALTVVLPSVCSAISFVHKASLRQKSYDDTLMEKELNPAGPAALIQTSASPLPTVDCHDAVEGDWCSHSINWLREKGLGRHPEWYPTLQPSSSNSWIQAELHRKGKSDCPMPCGDAEAEEEKQEKKTEAMESMLAPEQDADQITQDEQGEEDCRNAQPDTACYTAVTFGLAGGIRSHPDMFKGLTVGSDFKQIQESLYLQNRNGCERPCAEKHKSYKSFVKDANNYDSSGFREKKRIEDMSTEELSKYLDGKWDGFAVKKYKLSFNGEVTSTFQKRSGAEGEFLLTTTPHEEKESLPLISPEADEMTAAEADRYLEEARARNLEEARARKELEEREREAAEAAEAATSTTLLKKNVEDMSHEELSEYLNGRGGVEPALPALGSASTQEAIANDTASADEEALPGAANASETEEAANASETETAANGSEELEALPALALENVSMVKVSEDAGISDEPMPAVDADGNFVNASEETPEEVERRMEAEQRPEDERMEMEQQPHVEAKDEEEERKMEMEQQPHVETPAEMERRIRAEVEAKVDKALKESEEEMRVRIKSEVMYDLSKGKGE